MRSNANSFIISNKLTLIDVHSVISAYYNEIHGNFGLEDNELEEYLDCIEIYKAKVVTFINENPEYGI